MEEITNGTSLLDFGVTGAFLFYLYIKNGRAEKMQQGMTDALERNTRVLIKVATKHGYMEDADDLMKE
jgi:hypothetical protein